MVALAASLGRLPVKCGGACKDPKVRERWGCDHDAEPAGYTVHCWYCDGRGVGCEHCEGAGRLPVPRCPTRCRTPDVLLALEAWRWRQDGFLPGAGTWLDQTDQFLDVCRILDVEHARLTEEGVDDG